MRGYARGNCQRRRAPARSRVTGCASARRPRRAVQVLRVIELHVEALIKPRRKTPERRVAAAHIGMTDDAHRNIRRYELAGVTTDASFMSGETRRGGIVRTLVTRGTGKRRMALAVVFEG